MLNLSSSLPTSIESTFFHKQKSLERQQEKVGIFSHAHVTLYEGLSVRPSVGPSVRLSVRNAFFLTAEFKPKSDLTSINAPAQRA